jgi:hypothetical protein
MIGLCYSPEWLRLIPANRIKARGMSRTELQMGFFAAGGAGVGVDSEMSAGVPDWSLAAYAAARHQHAQGMQHPL